MYIESVPNRSSPPAILLRESYREDGKVWKRTLCKLSQWPAAYIDGLRGVLKGGGVIAPERDAFTVTRSLPHGHVAATLGTARQIGLDRRLGPEGNRCRDLVLALLVARILEPCSKLATARALPPVSATSGLGVELGLGEVDEDELYAVLDWRHERQPAIESALAKRHMKHGTLVLYGVSSSYLEGRCCPLAKRGYSRDGRRGTLQITYGLLCAPDGCPVAVEVFAGNTADPLTLASQVEKLKHHFTLEHVVLVGRPDQALGPFLPGNAGQALGNRFRHHAERIAVEINDTRREMEARTIGAKQIRLVADEARCAVRHGAARSAAPASVPANHSKISAPVQWTTPSKRAACANSASRCRMRCGWPEM